MNSEGSEHLQQAKNKAARYCVGAERSPHQVLTKLQLYGLELEDALVALEALKEANFTNEKRFVSAFVNDKFKFNKWGKIKISIELRKHKISSSHIEEGLSTLNSSDYESKINELIDQKWDQVQGQEIFLIKKKKTCQFVISKGFESHLVLALFDQKLKYSP
jgi:regulatory protein|tara:strand:+ start:482 stop:967 length:486 start_codon:yes stop_codon:yes gene_type:complete